MRTTVGFFYVDPLQAGSLYRGGKAELPLDPEDVAAVLPVLVRNNFAARALTATTPYDTLLEAVLSQGWQETNFLFVNGGWHQLRDMLGARGERLEGPAATEETPEEEPLPSTENQRDAIERMTRSHVFEADRAALLATVDNATIEQASLIFEFVKNQLAIRPRRYPKGGKEAYQRARH